MTEYEIVNQIARQGTLRAIIQTVTQDGKAAKDVTSLDDLEQDIYIDLLSKGEKLIEVWEQGHINFYLSRIVCNQIKSSTSPYYFKYLLPMKRSVEFDDRLKAIPDE
jgi:hypothetical protein